MVFRKLPLLFGHALLLVAGNFSTLRRGFRGLILVLLVLRLVLLELLRSERGRVGLAVASKSAGLTPRSSDFTGAAIGSNDRD